VRVLTEPKNALVKQYQRLFSMENADLQFTTKRCKPSPQGPGQRTGARGLRSIIEEVMLDIMYDCPSKGRLPLHDHQGRGRRVRQPILPDLGTQEQKRVTFKPAEHSSSKQLLARGNLSQMGVPGIHLTPTPTSSAGTTRC
jgi:hypothetical protein